MAELRTRRIRNEWDLLIHIQQINRQTLEVVGHETDATENRFMIEVHQTSGLVKGREFTLVRSHRAVFRFPRFYPSVPIEAVLSVPVFHPNVDSDTGFVCLWDKSSAGDTVLEAFSQLQKVVTWNLYNFDADQVMQPDAVSWYQDRARTITLPLPYTPIVEPPEFKLERTYSQRAGSRHRQRLFDQGDGSP